MFRVWYCIVTLILHFFVAQLIVRDPFKQTNHYDKTNTTPRSSMVYKKNTKPLYILHWSFVCYWCSIVYISYEYSVFNELKSSWSFNIFIILINAEWINKSRNQSGPLNRWYNNHLYANDRHILDRCLFYSQEIIIYVIYTHIWKHSISIYQNRWHLNRWYLNTNVDVVNLHYHTRSTFGENLVPHS